MSALALVAFSGCASTESEDRWSRHFDASVWSGALEPQLARPDRYVPELALLTTIPVSIVLDHHVSEYGTTQNFDSTTEIAADAFQFVLPAIPVAIGAFDWAHGDGGRNLEVVFESLASVAAVQQILAYSVGRERPDHSDNTSFPSGHTSWSFAVTTLIVRDLHDPSDDSFHALDALMYVPAILVGWERVASGNHWPSDVTCGAFLGVFLTNWIWDAHYSSDSEMRPTIFTDERGRGMAWSPSIGVVDGRTTFGIRGAL